MPVVRVLTLVGMLAVLSGCATLSYPLPRCDGYAKRPLNRSMWEWEGTKQPAADQNSALDAVETGKTAGASEREERAPVQTAFAQFDEAGSHRACQVG